MAESIFIHKLRKRDLMNDIEADSAGTGNWHVGDPPDHRTVRVLADHAIPYASKARQVKPNDFENFDLIVAMDTANLRDLQNWQGARPEKVQLMQSFDPESVSIDVPDPYYGDLSDFRKVYEMLDQSTERLMETLLQ
jgi:protein-tyrosine phosphatase